MEEPIHKKEALPKFTPLKWLRAEQQREKIVECMLVVSNFYFKNVSFSDELSFCEKSNKPKVILPVDLRCNGLGDI